MYYVDYGGFPVFYSFRTRSAPAYFTSYLHRCDQESSSTVQVSDERFRLTAAALEPGAPEGFVEFRSMIGLTSRALLANESCIFHAVSFIYGGYSWLLTAPSGTGKTTQYLNWMQMYPHEIRIICGDMPVICRHGNQEITVHPSPWNGKEKFGSQASAPLGGIICLSQSSVNTISLLKPSEAVIPLLRQFIISPENEAQIRALSRLTDTLVRNHPVWHMVNKGDLASTELLRMTIRRKLDHEIQNTAGSHSD